MKKKIMSVFILLLVIISTGCSMTNGDKVEVFHNQTYNIENEIIIGVAAPLDVLRNSTQYVEGLEMAVKEINKQKVLNKKISLVMQDDEASVTKGMAIAQSFSSFQGISAVIGHWNSRVSVPASAIYEKAGIVMITPDSTSPELTENGYNLIFRQIPSDITIADELAEYAKDEGFKRIAICYADDDYGRGLADAFEDASMEIGIKVIDRVSYLGGDAEFQKIRDRWEALEYDAILVADIMPAAASNIERIRQSGIDKPILGGDGLDYPQFIDELGEDAEGVVSVTLFNPNDQRPKLKTFIEEFTKEYGLEPDIWAVQGYETVKLLAYAIEQCGSSESDKIADALHSIDEWEGLTGNISFDDTGEVQGKILYKKIVCDGEYQYIP